MRAERSGGARAGPCVGETASGGFVVGCLDGRGDAPLPAAAVLVRRRPRTSIHAAQTAFGFPQTSELVIRCPPACLPTWPPVWPPPSDLQTLESRYGYGSSSGRWVYAAPGSVEGGGGTAPCRSVGPPQPALRAAYRIQPAIFVGKPTRAAGAPAPRDGSGAAAA
jgi:hypothetical protein